MDENKEIDLIDKRGGLIFALWDTNSLNLSLPLFIFICAGKYT